MIPSAKAIVIELTPPNQPETSYSDLTMMVMTGGRERTQREFETIFAPAGFALQESVPTQSAFTLRSVSRSTRRPLRMFALGRLLALSGLGAR